MQKSLQQLEQESAALWGELAKRIETDVEFVHKVAAKLAEFEPDQVRKWDPAVRATVRQEMTAAISRVRSLFSDAISDDGQDMISQFIRTAQGVIALLDCEQIGPTGTSSKAAGADGDLSKLDPVEQIKRIHAGGGQPMHKAAALPNGTRLIRTRDLLVTR